MGRIILHLIEEEVLIITDEVIPEMITGDALHCHLMVAHPHPPIEEDVIQREDVGTAHLGEDQGHLQIEEGNNLQEGGTAGHTIIQGSEGDHILMRGRVIPGVYHLIEDSVGGIAVTPQRTIEEISLHQENVMKGNTKRKRRKVKRSIVRNIKINSPGIIIIVVVTLSHCHRERIWKK